MPCRTRSSIFKALTVTTCVAVLAACTTNPQEAAVVARPKTLPVKNLTNFSESLRCMDRLFVQFGLSDMVITSAGIPDETGEVAAGTKDMLISAISRMSRKSGAFTFVDYDAQQTDVHDLQGLVGFTDDFEIPEFYIRGAVTQLDEDVLVENTSASAGYQVEDLSEDAEEEISSLGTTARARAATGQNVSVVSLDLNMGYLETRQILAGVSAQNSIAVVKSGYKGGLGGSISKLGLDFNITLNKGEGIHQAVRTLVELSTIEVLGKLAEVPYWRCLQIDHTNPTIVAESREWFEGMDPEEQIAFVQESLASSGYYGGPLTSTLDDATVDAIGRYQAKNNLLADGRINFDLYASLINQDLSPGSQATAPVSTKHLVPKTEALDANAEPLDLNLSADTDADGTFALNTKVKFLASTNQNAHVYCYYADANGFVARVFPNQFQPNSHVTAGQDTLVPSEEAGFDIVLDQVDANEQIACVASTKELALRLPEAMKQPDLAGIPVRSVDDVINAYRDLDPANLVEARLDLKVR